MTVTTEVEPTEPGEHPDKPNNIGTRKTRVWGAAAIGAVINKTESQTFYLLERGLLPAKKVKRQWTSTVEELQELGA
jgi:hypothetical protein